MTQEIFKRVEEKWLLPKEEYRRLLPELRKHMEEDVYGKYTISNIYYDTADFRLIRESLEKPVYKEKLRLRLYGDADENGKVLQRVVILADTASDIPTVSDAWAVGSLCVIA